ncbi:MAG: IS1634 family transposase, partial [Acidimicrobiales bacterium]
FDADRASLATRLVLDAIAAFDIDVSQLHTDTTSIKLSGVYTEADGRTCGGQSTVKATWGHSKDHRPDLKQLVWSLTVTADGAVPVCYRVADGNATDDKLHIPVWDELAAMLVCTDFLYAADSKLATPPNMDHIAGGRGRFLSVLPASRKEDSAFRDWIVDHTPEWNEALRRPARRQDDPHHVWWTTPAPWPSAEGYRITWVKSSAKIDYDAEARRDRIARCIPALDALSQRLASPKTRIKTAVAAEDAARAALDHAGATRWVEFDVETDEQERYRQKGPGRPNADTTYHKHVRTRQRITPTVREALVARDAASDGCFPLSTNDKDMSDAELLIAYKYQPNNEKRHAQLKGTQLVAPMFLKDPARIEGLLCCHFIALLTQALLERDIRNAMAANGLRELSVYPEDRGCAAPTAARMLDIFTGLTRHHLDHDGRHVKTFHPDLTDLQRQILDLLNIPTSVYTGPATAP